MMLGKMGDRSAVPPLIRALDAPGYQTPLSAVESLGQLGDPRAIDPLIVIAENSRDRLHEAAIKALYQLGCDLTTQPTANEFKAKQPFA